MFLLWTVLLLLCDSGSAPPAAYDDFESAPHSYYERVLQDPFTRLKAKIESGEIQLDHSSEKNFVSSLLRALDVPISSQILVFSTTSLQLSLISPANPRALYFNEDIYIGWVPGGKIEIASIDPALGAIFYIFDIPRHQRPIAIERSNRCMNCHSGSDTGFVPGLVIKSVVPGPTGGSLDAFRGDQTGHAIPLADRFGGWYLTGHGGLTNHWANLIGRLSPQGMAKNPVAPGERFPWDRYPVASSDLLPHLIHEHQAGFVNRVIEATYRIRAGLFNARGQMTDELKDQVAAQARTIVEYILFKNEAPLPEPIPGDPAFRQDFLRQRVPTSGGASLKDFDLNTRLFQHRCSYMVYTPLFTGMPPILKTEIFHRLKEALQSDDPAFAYLPSAEKKAIAAILRETLDGFPENW